MNRIKATIKHTLKLRGFNPRSLLVVLLVGLMISRVFALNLSEPKRGRDEVSFETQQRAAKVVQSNVPPVNEQMQTSTLKSLGKLPLNFEPNLGQVDPTVKFLARGSEYEFFLTSTEALLRTANQRPKPDCTRDTTGRDGEIKPEVNKAQTGATKAASTSQDILRIKLVGGNTAPLISGLDELPGKTNYLIGRNPEKWHTNVPAFSSVLYQDVYPGINQVYYGDRQKIEYDFIVSPGANPKIIKLAFTGMQNLRIDAQGNLVLKTAGGEIRQHKPVIYQEIDHIKHLISGHYVLKGKGQVGFEIGDYDLKEPLIIDPTISYSTYVGGSGFDEINSIAVDVDSNIYVTGSTTSSEYSSLGNSNAFIMKLNATGDQRIYLTIIGGSGDERGLSLALDGSDNAYVTGITESTDFATANPLQPSFGGGSEDSFIAKVDSTGSTLIYSSYLGGSGDDVAKGITVDNAGGAYITGSTDSPEFSSLGGTDVFVAKFNPAGSQRIYFAMLGGNRDDVGSGIAVDGQGNAYITGTTDSTNFTTVHPLQPESGDFNDAFIAKLNPTGSALIYSTYVGGNGDDKGFGIAVDNSGNAYVVGSTTSAEYSPVGGSDVFVLRLNAAGDQRLSFATIGGSGNDVGYAIAIDADRNIYLSGSTESTNFVTASPLQANFGGGSQDAFVAKMDPSGATLLYSSFLGGSGNEAGLGLATDANKSIYIAGSTNSIDLPLVSQIQSANGGGGDAFIAKINGIQSTPVGTLSLNSNAYSVNEGDSAGTLNFTVTRSGDTSSPVSVDFSTSDNSGIVPCQTNVNGIASDRCDYATAKGTLRFAAGDATSKTIQIPIINDAYQEPTETFTITLTNVQGGAALAISTATASIIDNDTAPPTQNPINDQAFFIKQQYIDFLGRVAEPAGFQFWMDRMNNCPAGQTCDRIDTSKRFFESDEFNERGFFVYRLYDVSLGRFPLYAEFVPDVARLNGVQTVAEQRANKDAYLADFLNKTEFRSQYGTYVNANGSLVTGQAAGFVNALCVKAGITPSIKQILINNLANGTRTPAQTLEDFILAPEISNPGTKFYDRARIVMQYFGYLRRDPEQGGFDFWWDQLTNPAKGHLQDYRFMVGGFLNSDEYKFRFAQ